MPGTESNPETDPVALVRLAALDQEPVNGLTHVFYRYPARFSPAFARTCIQAFSKPGDIVLDPYMGGGTTVVEAMVAGRRAVGSDINSLAVFIARSKVAELTNHEQGALASWATETVSGLRCWGADFGQLIEGTPRNMTQPAARWLRKTIALCLTAAREDLPTVQALDFARCVLLNVGQWALNGRRSIPSAKEFRDRVVTTTLKMLEGSRELAATIAAANVPIHTPLIRRNDAETIGGDEKLVSLGPADLVVTSPPYPGIHMLYHRWQVDGRKETDAPYWIAACSDGAGAVFYNFADRRREAEDRYFDKALRTFAAVRRAMRRGAFLVQMIAFSEPERQLRRYLSVLNRAGFREVREHGERRIWRAVPGRRWHANLKGDLPSSREVVLVHLAV